MRYGAVMVAALATAMAGPTSAEIRPERLSALPYALTLSNKAITAEITPDRLRLVAPKGSDLYSPAKGPPVDNAPRVTFAPKGDFILSAKVSRPEGSDYAGGALVAHAAGGRWVKLLFERLNASTNAVTSAVASPISDGSYHIRFPADAPALWLKMARAGGSLLLYSSQDGATWQILRDVPMDEAMPLSIGFAGQSPTGERYEAVFSNIRFEARKVKDYWQGK
ncbi:DUF1349 domain-containing protein [Sphingosinicella sp. BN140058]|uniref:DUF1349 domain-containing protein n=1 Tax=Sphingosinicella sp. BN140058 TaxID=1892855 RepID=UPI001012D339|nr:DUF1349 domain-containing protein [Sphingosinicella sp. BN140058]QAY77109.1 DUF1349 domain-containing protein [Sphingosinicella sp. BN140058]